MMSNTFNFWKILSQDVAFLGGPSSPLLSWLGVLGILLFFVWHVIKLKKEVASVQRGFERVCPMLATLAQERGDVECDRFTHRLDQGSGTRASRAGNPTMRSDCHDLQVLDGEMKKEPMFREPWEQYRRTLVLEKVPWFIEPRVFSTRPAEDVLTQEALLANRINLLFYQQFPSLVTGLGLLLTFLALFVGLGKLHAEGSEIVGIQGLINGLAGKFLTSIVGLIVANLFTFIEKPMVSRLMHAHHTFLGLIDHLFPRKTMEQMLEQLTLIDGQQQRDQVTTGAAFPATGGGWGMPGLAGPMASLTASIQSLTTMQETVHAETRRTMVDLPGVIRDELHVSLHELTRTIHELTKALKDPPQLARVELSSSSRPLLWKAPADFPVPSNAPPTGKAKSWPRWPRIPMQRRTG